MTLVSLDTNILVYGSDASAGARYRVANDVLARAAAGNCVLTQQVIGEYFNVSKRLQPSDQERVRNVALQLCAVFPILPTARSVLFEAFDLSRQAKLQFWDAVILAVCAANDVGVLLTADMQDGQRIGSVVILDPFDPANRPRLDALLGT